MNYMYMYIFLMQVDLAQLYLKAGLKNIGTVFLLTDAQVPDEKFLVLINDLLASGEIPDLFAGMCIHVHWSSHFFLKLHMLFNMYIYNMYTN